jgi:hypothetical protein
MIAHRWDGVVQGLPVQLVQPYGGLQGPPGLSPARHLLSRPPRSARAVARRARTRQARPCRPRSRSCTRERVHSVIRLTLVMRAAEQVQHQHLPQLGPRTALPRAVPQRRDQHSQVSAFTRRLCVRACVRAQSLIARASMQGQHQPNACTSGSDAHAAVL